MTSLQEAQQLVIQQAHSFGEEKVLLDDAVGRVLAEQVIADRDYPPFNRATMDGIAINHTDWVNGIHEFELLEIIYAGNISAKKLGKGQCYKIMTGAAVPLSADTVIRKEDIEENKSRLAIRSNEIKAGQNIAAKGSDIQKRTTIIKTSQLITPGSITTLASLGFASVEVKRLPSVAIITTGDEVVDIDAAVNEVQIRNSNAHLLKALLQQWKIKPSICEHIKDNADILLAAVAKQLHNDIIILSGAVSAGDADFVPEVLIKAGAKKIFHKAAIRPGKPIWFGKFENGATVFALPGNPFSTFVTFKLFLEHFLLACFGLPPAKIFHIPFIGNRIKKTNLDEFFPVVLSGNPTVAEAIPFNTSGDITAVMNAAALAMQPVERPAIKDGEIIPCIII
ncbi:MAG: molybdopterin molybdotransferase MoeA [Chitinophagaceae bacterium]|nr:molybdopterin molybdotransferase MoeA [Chitinophagaceae bacterium]